MHPIPSSHIANQRIAEKRDHAAHRRTARNARRHDAGERPRARHAGPVRALVAMVTQLVRPQ